MSQELVTEGHHMYVRSVNAGSCKTLIELGDERLVEVMLVTSSRPL